MLKMLGVYLDTLIIGHEFCIILCILNELTLESGIAKNNVNNVFWTQKTNKHNNNKIKVNIIFLARAGTSQASVKVQTCYSIWHLSVC